MHLPLPFDEDYRDCLQEITNIAMGDAGQSLASYTDTFVTLSIPDITYHVPDSISSTLDNGVHAKPLSVAVQHLSVNQSNGYCLLLLPDASLKELALTIESSIDTQEEIDDLILDLLGTINETCIPRMSRELNIPMVLGEKKVLASHTSLEDLVIEGISGWNHALSIKINYHLEQSPFVCDLFLLMPDAMLDSVKNAIQPLVED